MEKKQKSLKTRTKQILQSRVDKKKPKGKGDGMSMDVDEVPGRQRALEVGEKRQMNAADNISIAVRGVQVLDSRDPLGSRSKQIEDSVLQSGKRLVLLLNKIDLVPKDNVRGWLAHLRTQLPTIAFKASTQEQQHKLGRLVSSNLHTDSSKCIGADLVMKLLKNYCRNKDIKTTIRVGIVGFPNVGKSSVINSLKRQRTCQTGAVPGVTKQLQEVELDKNIRLIDSPGVVLASRGQFDATEVALKNALRVDSLKDPISPVQGVLRRCSVQVLADHFQINPFDSCELFLASVARKLGRLRKGGRPDLHAAAKHASDFDLVTDSAVQVLNEWNTGKLRYYTEPPKKPETEPACSTELLSTLSAEFDLDALEEDVKVVLEESEQMEAAAANPSPTEPQPEAEQVVVESAERRKKDTTDLSTDQFMPKSLRFEANVRLDSAIRKACKQNKKRLRRLAKKTDQVADLFSSLGAEAPQPVGGDVKMEDAQE